MTRRASTFDRIVALLAGLALIALGAAVIIWPTNWVAGLPEQLTAPEVVDATSSAWWPWAQAVAGVTLTALAVRWLLTHTPAAKIKALPLKSDRQSGALTVDLSSLAQAAAATVAASPMVKSASGKAIVDRGTRTIDLTVTVTAATAASDIVDHIDAVCAKAVRMIGDPTIATRATVRVPRKP